MKIGSGDALQLIALQVLEIIKKEMITLQNAISIGQRGGHKLN